MGPGAFSAYVTRAIGRQREHDRLGELVDRLLNEGGPLSEAEEATADEEMRDIERWFDERESDADGRAGAA